MSDIHAVPPAMVLAVFLSLLLVAAPMMFGATPRPALLLLCALASLLALAALASGARPAFGGWLFMAGLMTIGLLQLLPLPVDLLSYLSPEAASLRALSSGAASAAPLSLDPHATWTSLLLLGGALCVFAVARFSLGHPTGRPLLMSAVIGTGFVEAFYGIRQLLVGPQEIFGWPKLWYLDSASGTFVNRNHFAGYLEMALMLCLGWLVAVTGTGAAGTREEGAGAGSRWVRFVLSLATPRGAGVLLLGTSACVMAAALLMSHSRAGVASAAIGGLILAAIARRGTNGRAVVAVLVLVGAVGLAAVVMAGDAVFGLRVAAISSDLLGDDGRAPLWADAARMVVSFPLAGSGLGSFESVYPSQRGLETAQLYSHAHNDYVELAAEAGIPGLLAILMMAMLFFRRTLPIARGGKSGRRADSPALRGAAAGGVAAAGAMAVHSCFDFNLHVPANLLTMAAICAIALPGAAPWGEARA